MTHGLNTRSYGKYCTFTILCFAQNSESKESWLLTKEKYRGITREV